MQGEDKPDQVRMLDGVQRLVLGVLLARSGSGLCSMGELATLVGDAELAGVAVAGLHASGLVHRLHEFVFATRAAVRFHELDLVALALAGEGDRP